ncbi:MAG: hypothetical protein ACE5IK_01900 [Acidobacteriota bacterium]
MRDEDSARQFTKLVHQVAESIAPPAPPADLAARLQIGVPRRYRPAYWLAVATVLAGMAGLVFLQSDQGTGHPPVTSRPPRVVVERLDVRGIAVDPAMLEPAGAGVVVLDAWSSRRRPRATGENPDVR